jgi:hypothetical protein
MFCGAISAVKIWSCLHKEESKALRTQRDFCFFMLENDSIYIYIYKINKLKKRKEKKRKKEQ